MMLVADDNSWAICMPKKTGSHSLIAMLGGVAHLENQWHGVRWDGDGRRLMVVRNPRDRLLSMFWFTARWNGPVSPVSWLDIFITKRSMWSPEYVSDSEWYCTLSEMARAFRPDDVFRLEDGLSKVCEAVGVVATEVREFVTPPYPSLETTFADATASHLRFIEEFTAEDMERWYTNGK